MESTAFLGGSHVTLSQGGRCKAEATEIEGMRSDYKGKQEAKESPTPVMKWMEGTRANCW